MLLQVAAARRGRKCAQLVADVSATCTVPLVLTRFVHVTQFTDCLTKNDDVLFDLPVRTSRARFLRQPRDRRKSQPNWWFKAGPGSGVSGTPPGLL